MSSFAEVLVVCHVLVSCERAALREPLAVWLVPVGCLAHKRHHVSAYRCDMWVMLVFEPHYSVERFAIVVTHVPVVAFGCW